MTCDYTGKVCGDLTGIQKEIKIRQQRITYCAINLSRKFPSAIIPMAFPAAITSEGSSNLCELICKDISGIRKNAGRALVNPNRHILICSGFHLGLRYDVIEKLRNKRRR